MIRLRRLIVVAFLLTVVGRPLQAADDLVFTPYKPGGVYARGETVGWTVTGPAGAPAATYTYEVRRDNFEVIGKGTLDLSRPGSIETSLPVPGMVLVEVKSSAPDAKPRLLGAAVAPEAIGPSAPRPADFDAFWAAKIEAMQKIPANPVLTEKDSGRADVDYAILRMDHIEGRHIWGQVAKPKRAGKFPGLVIYQWASPPYPLQRDWVTERAAEGWLAVNIEPHDVLPDQPKEYYDALPAEIKKYNEIGRESRDKSYFLQMYLADYRAIEYLASRPDWDGTTLVVTGTSMGGQQSLCAAGLNPKVTGLIVHVPAGADGVGPLHGRAAGYPNWPADDAAVMQTAPYFDTVNCASRIRVPSLLSMGFVDTVSPPVGIFAAFNQIRGPKEAAPMPESPHNHQATPEQMAPYTTRQTDWMRTMVAGGDVFEPADQPSPRRDANSQKAHEDLLAKKTKGRIDLYFVGDSITRRWGAAEPKYQELLAHWKQTFFGWNAADFGWGADKTQNMLWRLQNGELDGVNPKVIVVMAGTNNIGRVTPVGDEVRRADEVVRGVSAILGECRKRAPGARIVLMGITPRNDNPAVMPIITRANAELARLADGQTIRFLDLAAKMADAHGRLLPGMTDPDLLHLSPKGYQVWADALKPVLTELLGPPATVDHAPPPTGDPSAMAQAAKP
jgi:cephalosporin-C deacetylase-like acetyl esterase/lysophospholipase L1-like esterase